MTILEALQEYLVARWNSLRGEVKITLDLDDPTHRDFLKNMWTRQFLDQKIEDLSVQPPTD